MREHTSGADITGLTGGAMRLTGRVDPSKPQWWRAARWMLGMQLYLGLWFWGVIAVLWVVAVVIFSRTAIGVQTSYLQFAVHGALWFPFAMTVTLVAAQLTVHVANGMTRSSFVRATLVTVVAMSLGYGLVLAGGLQLEGLVYDAFGWSHVHVANIDGDNRGMAEPWDHGLAASTLTYAVRTFSGAVAGLLVAVAYYRYGGWRGTALLPLTVLPALLGQDALASFLGGAAGLPQPVYALLALVVPLLGAIAYHRLARSVPIATSRS